MRDIKIVAPNYDKMSVRGVYKITFDDAWFYIGGSVDMRRRFIAWKHKFLNGIPKNENMRLHIDSVKSIKFEILETVNLASDVLPLEDRYIKENMSNIYCMNLCPNSDTPKGKVGALGKRKYKLSKSTELNDNSNDRRSIKVAAFDKSGNYIKIFPSLSAASKELNVRNRGIGDVINGHRKSLKGYIFKKVSDDLEFIEPIRKAKSVKSILNVINWIIQNKSVIELNDAENIYRKYIKSIQRKTTTE